MWIRIKKEDITLAPGLCSIEAEVWRSGVKSKSKLDFKVDPGNDYDLFALDVPKGVDPATITIIRKQNKENSSSLVNWGMGLIIIIPVVLIVAGVMSLNPPKIDDGRYVWIQEKLQG